LFLTETRQLGRVFLDGSALHVPATRMRSPTRPTGDISETNAAPLSCSELSIREGDLQILLIISNPSSSQGRHSPHQALKLSLLPCFTCTKEHIRRGGSDTGQLFFGLSHRACSFRHKNLPAAGLRAGVGVVLAICMLGFYFDVARCMHTDIFGTPYSSYNTSK
jgi:hypothetical protein